MGVSMNRWIVFALVCAGLLGAPIVQADQELSCDFGTDGASGMVIFSGALPPGVGRRGFPEDFVYGFNSVSGNYFTQHGVDLRKARPDLLPRGGDIGL